MEYLKVKNWEEYQHYKDRCPPWIKLHTKILNDRSFTMLSCASRGLLMQLWILASEHNGKVPNDLEEIKFRLRDNKIKQADVNHLIKLGFLNGCKQMQADASTCLPEERRGETETEGDVGACESKKDPYIAPTLEEVETYFSENGYSLDAAKQAFKYYEESKSEKGHWYDGRGNLVRNWKMKMRSVWFKSENETQRADPWANL